MMRTGRCGQICACASPPMQPIAVSAAIAATMTIAKEPLRPSIALRSNCEAIDDGDLGVFAALPARINVRQEWRIGKGRNRLHELHERLIFQTDRDDRLSFLGVAMPHRCVRWRACWLALCSAAALIIADVPGASAAKIKMVFPGPVTTFSLPYLVAQKKGWMGGLEVEHVHVTGDANAMRVLLSGNADIGLIGTLNVLASIHAGAGIRAVHSWQPIGDYNLVLATGKGSKLADLAGKTFASSGPGGLPDQLPRLIMRKHGIDEATARFVQVGGHAARLQAVIGGRADATLVNTVTALKGVQEGKVTAVARLSAEFPGLGYIWNVVRTDTLSKPELAAAFQSMTDIGVRGSRYIMENPDDAAAILHERLPDLDLAFLKAVVRDLNSENLWGVDGGLDPAIEQFTADLNMQLGNLPVAPAASAVLEPRFVDAALRQLGTYQKK